MPGTIEVFSDLVLHLPHHSREEALRLLVAAAQPPWTHDAQRSEDLRRNSVGDRHVQAFRRAALGDLPEASLSVWSHDEGLYVPNVVPFEVGELTYDQYNQILADFAKLIAEPVANQAGWRVELSPGRKSLSDWVPKEVAQRLSKFSTLANKSTGAGHPLDQARWFDFIVAAHRSGTADQLDVERLARWLIEVERWDEDSAYRLAGDYERSISLLQYADTH